MIKHLAAVLVMAFPVATAPAAVVQVDVPAHVEWCNTIIVTDSSALSSPEAQQKVFRRGQEPIALCARNGRVERIGVPFVRSVTTNPQQPSELSLMFCSVMKSDAQPCEGIEKQNVGVTKVLAAVCPREASTQCMSEVTAVLRAEPFKLDDAAIERVQWRFAGTGNSSATPEAIAAALNSTETQGVFGQTQATGPNEPLPFVVVAAPAPVVKTPPAPAVPAAPPKKDNQP